ncbi:MAG: hypothetical protein JWP96_1857 [Polaromonas sp.]|nr:hypothetical protein [Polaromonas sp.]
MYFLGIGILALVLKYLAIGFVADLSWWLVLSPFALAAAWWSLADASGYTKRKEIEKMDQRKQTRLDKQQDALGMLRKKRK